MGGSRRGGPSSPVNTSPGWRRTRVKSPAVNSSPTAASSRHVKDRDADVDQEISPGAYRRIVSWTPACRGAPGRPPMAGRGVLKVPVM